MNQDHDWLLVFPPLISTNWGSYYPSTAILAAVLHEHGVSTEQLDLNAELLDYLIDPEQLANLEAGFRKRGHTPVEHVPLRAAANLVMRVPGYLVDANGRHVCDGEWNGHALAVELSRSWHIDLPIPAICDPDFASEHRMKDYERFVADSRFDDAVMRTRHAVGITIPMGPQLPVAILLARRIKQLCGRLKVVFGGPAMTLASEQTLDLLLAQVPQVNAIVRFEGERPILDLALQLRANEWRPQSVSAVRTRESRHGPAECDPVRVNDVPFARFSKKLLSRLAAPRVGILQARGCYWGRCKYCDFIELYSMKTRYDGKHADRVHDEVTHLHETYGIERFWLVTEALPPAQGLKFASRLLDSGVKIDWRSFAMVDQHFTVDVLRTLNEAGCSSLTIGLETTSDRVLQHVDKQAGRKENISFLDRAAEAELPLTINLIPNLPSTRYEEAMRTLEDLAPYADSFHAVSVFPYEATASSSIGRNPKLYGLTIKGEGFDADGVFPNGQAQFASNRLVYSDPAMSRDELERVYDAYSAFSRDVRRRQIRARSRANGRTADQRRLRISEHVVAMKDRDSAIVYDWDADRLVCCPQVVVDAVNWVACRRDGVTLSQLANHLDERMPIREVSQVCHWFTTAAASAGIGEYGK